MPAQRGGRLHRQAVPFRRARRGSEGLAEEALPLRLAGAGQPPAARSEREAPHDRYLKRRLAEEFKRAQRYAASLSAMMLDLDHFKQINDKYGHDCGDQVLRDFGKLLVENAREIDIVGRFGGEEFLIVLPNTDGIRAAIVAERVRKAAEENVYKYKEFLVRITVSAGIASFPANVEIRNESDLLKAADGALYRAKQA
ncbi:MAG: hypothetical protein DMF50_00520, partial [Acidobacteria bacterium]